MSLVRSQSEELDSLTYKYTGESYMSHFTDNLYLHREIQRLLNENNQMKSLLSEYRGPYDTGENIGGFDFRTPEEKAEEDELEKKRKEAAKKITTDELTKMMSDAGFKGTPEEYSKQIRKERFAIRKKAKDAAAAGARSAEDFQKAVENKSYKLNAFQQKMYDKYGTAYLEKLSRGLSKGEASRLASGAKVTDQADLDRLKATKDVPFIGSRSDAEAIIRRREASGYDTDGAEDYVSAKERSAQLGKASGDRFRAGQDETIRRNREEALRTSTGQKVRDFNALVSGQQAQIKQFGQQMSKLDPKVQKIIQDRINTGKMSGEEASRFARSEIERNERLRREAEQLVDQENKKEAEARNKAQGERSATQAIQDILGRFQ